jgi:hypothetical protein
MSVLWTFMGASPAYTIFSGIVVAVRLTPDLAARADGAPHREVDRLLRRRWLLSTRT